jgi:hypothetical protein
VPRAAARGLRLAERRACMQVAGQYLTLLFVGFISLNSLRAFLSVLRQVSGALAAHMFGIAQGWAAATGGAAAAAERMVLGLGALLCAYTVSSVMLMRAQLPPAHRGIVSAALGFDDAAANSELDAVHRRAPPCMRHMHVIRARARGDPAPRAGGSTERNSRVLW